MFILNWTFILNIKLNIHIEEISCRIIYGRCCFLSSSNWILLLLELAAKFHLWASSGDTDWLLDTVTTVTVTETLSPLRLSLKLAINVATALEGSSFPSSSICGITIFIVFFFGIGKKINWGDNDCSPVQKGIRLFFAFVLINVSCVYYTVWC